jgi:hypothetical protein
LLIHWAAETLYAGLAAMSPHFRMYCITPTRQIDDDVGGEVMN